MNRLQDILLFCAANIVGFFSTAIVYHLALYFGMTPSDTLIKSGVLHDYFFTGTMLTWFGCAILSLGFFFFPHKGRGFILLLPALLPGIYGFSVLIRLLGAEGAS